MPPVVVLPDISSAVTVDDQLSIDFLMPSGVLIPMKINFYSSLEIVKQVLWSEAEKYPLFKLLGRSDSYCFVCVNKIGEKEEILDESQSLDDVRPFSTFLKLVERKGDESQKTLVRNINSLVGKAGPQKVEYWQSAEVSDFRSRMSQFCDKIVQTRKQQGWIINLKYSYPPRLRSKCELPDKLKEKLHNDHLVIDVRIEESQANYKFRLPAMSYPDMVIQTILQGWSNRTGRQFNSNSKYLLKVFGMEEYLFGDYPLQQFKYVYQCLVRNIAPQFWLLPMNQITDAAPGVPPRIRPPVNPPTGSERSREKDKCVLEINEKYYITVRGISKVQLPDGNRVKLFMGIYHGSESLCAVRNMDEVMVEGGACNMKADMVFEIAVNDIPHMARLCFTLYTAARVGKKSSKDFTPVAWVNVAIFDFRSRLMKGDRDLPMWPITDDLQLEDACHPIGSVSPNPQGHEATTLLINFPDYNTRCNIKYPAFDKVLECAALNMEQAGTPGSAGMKPSKSHIEQLRATIARDPFSPLFEQDKELIWVMRYECWQRFADALPRVLSSVKWNNHVDVAKMIALLQTWPDLEVDYALELLDFDYPDLNVRKFAVKCLDLALNDADLSQYLLQLVQALKFETHLCSPLVEFLLSRALKNQHIGHQLFWLLKSEMHNPSVAIHFRLILEVYLKATEDHLTVLVKQQEALGKLEIVNTLIKSERYASDPKSREKAKADMQAVLKQKTYNDILSNLFNPLTPLYKLKELVIDKCKFMNSKKRPLWLVWNNGDSMGPDISLIYKNGDDLRQDMLTLQLLQIMDNIWKSEGLDLRMNPYGCVATGQEQGMIEVVDDSQTIANIQKWYNRGALGAFDKKALFEWLKMKNPQQESLDEAVEEFILSCAGYCVATYVLGIGDRHNDNIMLKQSGQLFHIDFGHFLGNFKSKFGVKRERVPFVLTTHFVYVMKKGEQNKNDNFKRFQNYCEKAYLILRRKGHLLFSLFMMMLSSGIPQLTCIRDVDYLRETLVPHMSDDDALSHFRAKFRDALKNSWTTSVNFAIHIIAR